MYKIHKKLEKFCQRIQVELIIDGSDQNYASLKTSLSCCPWCCFLVGVSEENPDSYSG